jgi:hypothetical protein
LQRVVLSVTLAVSLAGCAASTFSDRDMQWHVKGDTVYVMTRSQGVSRGLCASLGGDVAFAEARWAADEGRSVQLGRVAGCHTVRHIIVCTDDDAACVGHEERHRREGAFHP